MLLEVDTPPGSKAQRFSGSGRQRSPGTRVCFYGAVLIFDGSLFDRTVSDEYMRGHTR